MSSDNLTTQPMLNAILERLNEIDVKFMRELENVRKDIEAVRSDVAAVRSDFAKNFRVIEKKLEVIGIDILKLRADIRDIDERVERLEQKPA